MSFTLGNSKLARELTVPLAPARTAITIIAPCFNEIEGIDHLAERLTRFAQESEKYEYRFLLVDDGSIDGTPAALRRLSDESPAFRAVLHERNQGLTAAILTGLQHAETEIVCSIDSDCSYDPAQLEPLISALVESDADLATASPYHPQGEVRNVPAWRLVLSKGCSSAYRLLMPVRLHTYTSCFRAYRRSRCLDLPVSRTGFTGLVEMIYRLARRGGTIVESPAVLDIRRYGQSKLRTLRTVREHVGLMLQILGERFFGSRGIDRRTSDEQTSSRSPVV